jgi:hypothetical protein
MSTVYDIRVALRDISPSIWRSFTIDGETSFAELHDILQIVMGWENTHLYQFRYGKIRIAVENEEDPLPFDASDAFVLTLNKLKAKKGDTFQYVYDFGDNWVHQLEILSKEDDREIVYPVCFEGERNCPPENIGGIPGYLSLIEAAKKPRSKAYKEYVNWLGGDYDAEEFDIVDINSLLEDYTDDARHDMFLE